MTASGDVLTVHEAAAILQVGEKHVRRLCKTRRLRHLQIDGRHTIRIKREWIDQYLDRASQPVKGAA